MEPLVVFLIFGAIAAANYFLKKSSEGNASNQRNAGNTVNRPPVYRPVPPQREESDEERTRRFMEALGVPVTSPPPRKIERSIQTPRPEKTEPSPAKPVKLSRTTPAPSPAVRSRKPVPASPPPVVQPVMVQSATPPQDPSMPFPEAVVLPVNQVTELPSNLPGEPKTEVVSSNLPKNIQAMLRNRDNIRKAILLREIIDSPRGLQSYR